MNNTDAAAPGADRTPKYQAVIVLIITLLIQAMVVAAALAPTVIAPVIVRALGLSDSAIGVYISILYIGAIFSALYSSTLISKWGPIRISQFGLLLCATGLLLTTSGVIWLATLGALLVGLGYGPITPASSHILIRTTPARRLSLVFSIKQTGVPLGGAMVGFLIPPQEMAFGWAWALLSVSVACALMSLVAQRVRRELDIDLGNLPRQSFVAEILSPIRLVMSHRVLRVMAGCSFVLSGVQLTLFAFLPTYLNRHLGWTLLAAGVGMSVAQMAGMGGRVVWGAVADHGLGARKTLTLLTSLIAASCVALALFQRDMHPFWVYAALVLTGASAVGWNGVYLAEVARLAPQGKASVATGGTLAFTFLGIVCWPPLFGVISQASGSYRIAYLLFCLPLLVCLVSLFRGLRR